MIKDQGLTHATAMAKPGRGHPRPAQVDQMTGENGVVKHLGWDGHSREKEEDDSGGRVRRPAPTRWIRDIRRGLQHDNIIGLSLKREGT